MHVKPKIRVIMLLALLAIFWAIQSPSVQAYDEYILVDVDSQEFAWGFTNNATKKWWDNVTEQEESLILTFDQDNRSGAIDSPTGSSQSHNTILFLYGHEFIWGWRDSTDVNYRPSTNQTTGAETDISNMLDTGDRSDAVDSPTGSSQSHNTILFLYGHEFIWGWRDDAVANYRPSDNQTSGPETDSLNQIDTGDRSGATDSPTGSSQSHSTVTFVYGHEFAWGWADAGANYRPSTNQTSGPETAFIPYWNGTNSGTREEAGGIPTGGPTASNVASNTTQAGATCLFSANWSDPDGLSGYIFGTNNTGSWVNDTWTSFNGGTWSNITKTLTTNPDTKVEWQIWVNNTLNDWGDTDLQDLTTTDTSEPETSPDFTPAPNTKVSNDEATFKVKWQDKGKLYGWIFGWNGTGSWINDTLSTWAEQPSVAWSNKTKQLPKGTHIKIRWRVWANDTKGNWGDTGEQNFTTTEIYLNFAWQDRDGASISAGHVTWQLWNSTHNLEYTQGEATLHADNYTLKTFRRGVLVDTDTTVDTGLTGTQNATYTETVEQMKAHQSTANAYITVNNTISALTVHSETSTNLTFTISGSTPMSFDVDVPKEPQLVKKDGILFDGWSYNSGSAYVTWASTSLSTFAFQFEQEGSSGSSETPPSNQTYIYQLRVQVTYLGEPLKLANVSIRNLDLPFEYSDGLGWTTFKVPHGTHKILVYHPEYGYKQKIVEVTGNMQVTIDMEGATPEPPEEEGPSGWWGGIIEWFENILKEKKIEPRTTLWLALPILALGIFLILLPKDKKKRKFKYSYLKKKLGG